MDTDNVVREHVLYLLRGGGAHLTFDDAIEDLPAGFRGKLIQGAPHTIWELVEHMRTAQRDILEFSRSPNHVSPKFPEGYWPEAEVPPSDAAWLHSVESFHRDLKAMERFVENPSIDLYARIPHGGGQTILREALLIADHNAYHLGQLVLVKRLLTAL